MNALTSEKKLSDQKQNLNDSNRCTITGVKTPAGMKQKRSCLFRKTPENIRSVIVNRIGEPTNIHSVSLQSGTH